MAYARVYLFALVFLTAFSAVLTIELDDQADTAILVTEGLGTTQDAAKRQANLAALRQAAGTRVFAATYVKDMATCWERIAQFTDGYILSSRIVEGPSCSSGICRVKVEVEVAMAPLETDLRNISEMIGEPVVAVTTESCRQDDVEAARLVEQELASVGVRTLATDNYCAFDARAKADILITTQVNSRAQSYGDTAVVHVRLRLRITETSTEAVLANRLTTGRGNSVFDEDDAASKAVIEAVGNLSEELKTDIRELWYDFLKNGQVYRIVYRSSSEVLRKYPRLRNSIQLVPGLRAANERSLSSSEAVVDIRFEGLAGELISYLRSPLADAGLKVVHLERRRIVIGDEREGEEK